MSRSDNPRRRLTELNLGLCFPDLSAAQRQTLVRKSLVQNVCVLLELPPLWYWSPRRMERLIVETNGLERLQQATAGDRGLLVLTPHYGNWELVSYALYQAGLSRRVSVLFRNPEWAQASGLSKLVTARRARWNARLLPISLGAVRDLLRSLKNGEVGVVLPDQLPRNKQSGSAVSFFGVPTLTMNLAHRLTMRTGCAVMYCFIRRVSGGFAVDYLPCEDDFYSQDARRSAQSMNDSIERYIRAQPSEQYLWAYKRFSQAAQPPLAAPTGVRSEADGTRAAAS